MVVQWAKGKDASRGARGRYGDRYSDRRGEFGRNSFRDDRGSGFRGSRDGPRRPVECYTCGERGHFARDCRKGDSRGSGRSFRDSGRSNGGRRHDRFDNISLVSNL